MDILKRWHALTGKKSILCTGTDEHGMKVQQAAKKAGEDTKAFCDQNCEHFVRLAKAANIDYDHFIRTTDPDHRFAVQHFWLSLKERGFIYQSKHEGWYSVSDETFYPPSQVRRALDPATGRTFLASVETGKEVEWTSEINYHFKLSQMRDKLLQYYKENPNFIVPETRMKEVVAAVTEGLEDLSVSRPRERLNWGIPVPDDDSQTIYVWLDALINYITKSNYPFQIPGEEHLGGWPADVQVVGKDIVRFHCIYWPAFLLALGIPPPKQVLTHAHWTLGRQKMAKSTGNVVDPFFAMDRFGVDVMRYYLAHNGGIRDDADYENSFILREYKKGLQGGIGNLTTRLLRSKKWSVREAVQYISAADGDIDPLSLGAEHIRVLKALPSAVAEKFASLDSGAALREIMAFVAETNRFITDAAPWHLTQLDPGIKDRHLNTTIFALAESLRICGLLLQPFMPEKSAQLLDMLGVASDRRMCTEENLRVGADYDYGVAVVPLRGEEGTLFPRLACDEPEPRY